MKNNKGFTMVELIAVFLIIAAISVIGVVSVKSIMERITLNYYSNIEEELLLAGSEYFSDHSIDRPIDSYNKVDLNTLINNKYIEKVLDRNGKDTCSGNVYIYKKSKNYGYQSCLVCDGYSSSGDYCNNLVKGIIFISGITSNMKSYNGNLSYENTPWINVNYVDFSFSTANNDVYRYVVNNINSGEKFDIIATNGIGKIRINKTGAYNVIGYNNKDIVVGETKNFNVKFDKSGPIFDLSNNDTEFIFEYNNDHYNYSNKIINLKDDNGIKSVKVTLNGTREYANNSDITGNLNFNYNLVSGKYKLTVKVTDVAGNTTTKTIKEILVLMPVKLIYVDLDGKQNNKGYKYVVNGEKYGYYKSLAEKYNTKYDVEVDWYLDSAKKKKINDNTIVNNDKPHTLYAYDRYIVQASPTSSYCSNPTYNGNYQKVTKGSDVGFTFENNSKIYYADKGYSIKAKLNPGFIWDDMTLNDKYINCNIKKRNLTISSYDVNKTFDGYEHSDYRCKSEGLASGDVLVCLATGARTHSGNSTNTISVHQVLNGISDATNSYNIKLEEGTIKIDKKTINCVTGNLTCVYDSCDSMERRITATCNNLPSGWNYTPFVNRSGRDKFFLGVGNYPGILDLYTYKIYIGTLEVTSDCNVNVKKGDLKVEVRSITFNERSCEDITYDGKSHVLLTADSSINDYVKVNDTTGKVNAGSYMYTATLKDPVNTQWSGGGTGSKTVKCELKKKKITNDVKYNTGLVYNGKTQTLASTSSSDIRLTNASAKNAGKYTVKASLMDKVNTMWSDGSTSDISKDIYIAKKTLTITAKSCDFTYDGIAHICGGSEYCDVKGLVNGERPNVLDCGTVTEVGPGTYVVTAGGRQDDNYDVVLKNGTLKITDTSKPTCSISVAALGKLSISCSDNTGEYSYCGFSSSYSGSTSKTVTKAGTYYGYVKDKSGNTNSCSKKVNADTQYRVSGCKTSSCSSYSGYGTPSTSNVTSCTPSGSKGTSASYTTCESKTLYYGTCKSHCCYGTAQNCSTSAETNAGTGYYTSSTSAKNAASCRASCNGTPLVDSWAEKGYKSVSGFVKKKYSGGTCDSYSCSAWKDPGVWSYTECTNISSSKNESSLRKCETRTIFS